MTGGPATEALRQVEAERRRSRKRRRSTSDGTASEKQPKHQAMPCDLLSLYDSLTEGEPFPTLELTSDSEEDEEDVAFRLRPGRTEVTPRPVHSLRRNQPTFDIQGSKSRGLRRCKTCISDLAMLQAAAEESSSSLLSLSSSTTLFRPINNAAATPPPRSTTSPVDRGRRRGDDVPLLYQQQPTLLFTMEELVVGDDDDYCPSLLTTDTMRYRGDGSPVPD